MSALAETNSNDTYEILHKVSNVGEVYKAPRLAPETYPGDHPETTGSVLDGDNLYACRWNSESTLFLNTGKFEPVLDTSTGSLPLDEYLKEKGVPTLGERYPLTVFGSNRNPGQLLDKFRRENTGDTVEVRRNELEITPIFMGILKGYDTVYNAKPGNLGYFFADLYQGPETTDTEIEVAVLFLTKEQLEVIHRSEKAYAFKLLGEVEVGKTLIDDKAGDTFRMPAFAHVGKVSAYGEKEQDEQLHPVAVSEVYARNRTLSAMGQAGFQDFVFSNDPNGAKQKAFAEVTGRADAQANSSNYVANMKMQRAGGMRSLDERKAFQAALIDAIGASEKMVIDPDQFETTTIDPDSQPIPRLGDIAVFNFIEAYSKK